MREGIRQSGDVTDNAPLRSGKGSLYAGGTRDPQIVRWPGVIALGTHLFHPRNSCGSSFLHCPRLLGGRWLTAQPLDGESLVPMFRDEKQSCSGKPSISISPLPGSWSGTAGGRLRLDDPEGAVETAGFLKDGRLELYHLTDDPGESKNLVDSEPERFQRMLQEMRDWRTSVSAPMPIRNSEQTTADEKDQPQSKTETDAIASNRNEHQRDRCVCMKKQVLIPEVETTPAQHKHRLHITAIARRQSKISDCCCWPA